MIALEALHYLSPFPVQSEEQSAATMRVFHDGLAAAVRGLVEGGSPAGTDPALRETKPPVTVLAIRDLAAPEALERYGDRLDFVLVDLGSHHFPVEAPEQTAKLLDGCLRGRGRA
ncbi:hypothetical protein [Catenulispora rubra]|uniref:hypothetical protein n=1 Tax=Catenulispora rubra TaxID=280293 RepID=UPI001E31D9BE|nr:hypothetical protein [Catenulispora rubra]